MCPRVNPFGFAGELELLVELVGSDMRRRNRVDRSREHGGLGFGLWDATTLAFAAPGVNDRGDHREVRGDGEIAPEDALLLRALDRGSSSSSMGM